MLFTPRSKTHPKPVSPDTLRARPATTVTNACLGAPPHSLPGRHEVLRVIAHDTDAAEGAKAARVECAIHLAPTQPV